MHLDSLTQSQVQHSSGQQIGSGVILESPARLSGRKEMRMEYGDDEGSSDKSSSDTLKCDD
jgi:hypothetical protein